MTKQIITKEITHNLECWTKEEVTDILREVRPTNRANDFVYDKWEEGFKDGYESALEIFDDKTKELGFDLETHEPK